MTGERLNISLITINNVLASSSCPCYALSSAKCYFKVHTLKKMIKKKDRK
jgi:hypothetical protein